MSDEEEYEYEYDEDAEDNNNENDNMEEDEEDKFEYTDEEEEADAEVALENAYYNSKGLRETDLKEAEAAFEQVIAQERQELLKAAATAIGGVGGTGAAAAGSKEYGPWSYKAMKQLVKLHLRTGNAEEMMKQYNRLLVCIAQGNVSPNAIEKGINGMLERISALYQGSRSSTPMSSTSNISSPGSSGKNTSHLDGQRLALQVYDATLKIFHPQIGSCPNERLWFKTNLKYGQLLYEMNETAKLQQVLRDLKSLHQGIGGSSSSHSGGDHHMDESNHTSNNNNNNNNNGGGGGGGSSTQSMEIYALQIQLYSRQKDHKKLREVFNKAMAVRGGIPHPRTLALIQELGGKMHMAAREYESAGKTFFQAFKSYDEAGDTSRLRCLKYLVLASMLGSSSINPFDSQEARPYRDDPEIVAMTNLVHAFHNNDIQSFERILRQNQGRIMEDEFVREHVEDLLRTIRTQVLRSVIRPYKRISLTAISKELNDIPTENVESLLVNLILDNTLDGQIDKVAGVLLKKADKGPESSNNGSGGHATGGGGVKSPMLLKFEAMEKLAKALDEFSASVTNATVREAARGMVQ